MPPVGLLPAAGRGTRFGAAGYVKELFPIFLPGDAADAAPRPICALALRQIQHAGAERCAVVVSAEKLEVMRVLGDGSFLDLSLGYVVQTTPRGLPHVVRCARPWLDGADVVFALPDTVILPTDALARVHQARLAGGFDLMLGVFPVDEPERLAPVELDADGGVVRIHDKPGHRRWMNSWGLAAWGPRFTDFCCEWDAKSEAEERVLSHAFEAARTGGLAVGAVPFSDGAMLDIGTPPGLRAALAALAEKGAGADQ